MRKYLTVIVVLLFISCGSTTIQEKSETVFDIVTKSYLYSDPESSASKLINIKASQITGETQYLSIDRDCRVIILETVGEWSKVKVIEPDWLKDSHIGWVKTDVISANNTEQVQEDVFYKNKDYQVLYSKKHGSIETYRILVFWKQFDKNKLSRLTKFIKNEVSPNSQCNIAIYDSKDIIHLIEKYPLNKTEYIRLAEHFVYELYSDGSSTYYPLIDIQYKEYGGTMSIE